MAATWCASPRRSGARGSGSGVGANPCRAHLPAIKTKRRRSGTGFGLPKGRGGLGQRLGEIRAREVNSFVTDPTSADEWLALSRQHEASAKLLCENKVAAAQGMFHAGLSVECALKAYIMRGERLNGWPSKLTRPELYTHD